MNLDLPQIGGECQDFTRWWNSEGQFLQPIGDMQSEYGLDFAKKIAESVYVELHGVIVEAEAERDLAQKTVLAFDEMTALIKKIKEIVEVTLSTKDQSIKSLIEEYCENNED